MTLSLTREQLYDLVWAEPMTKVAEELGISDVMLAKICRQKDVPRLPRGYWANLDSSKKRRNYVKPLLPDLRLGVSDFNDLVIAEYAQREAARTDRFDWDNLDAPIPDPPKPPEESQEEAVARLAKKLPEIPEPGSFKTLHPIAQKIFNSDRNMSRFRDQSIFDPPGYGAEDGKRLLEALNGTLWTFHRLGFKPTVNGRVHFRTHIRFAGDRKDFVFFLMKGDKKDEAKRSKKTSALKICFAWESEMWHARRERTYQTYDHFTADNIRNLVLGLLTRKEHDYRERVVDRYTSSKSHHQELIKEAERKRLQAIALERARIVALLNKRLELLADAGKRIHDSDRIRELVAVFDAKAKAADQEIAGFDAWSRWALQHADDIDPRHMSIRHFEAWIQKFSLETPRNKSADGLPKDQVPENR
jgi:hypothetical protein